MKPSVAAAINAHALAEYPRECCGLLVGETYVPCRNQAQRPSDHFALHPEDFAAAEDAGEITAVVHSHPDVSAKPSEGDRVACETSGLPWIIVSVLKGDDGLPYVGDVSQMQPEGYEAPLVGRMFHHGVLDCYTLVRDWYKRELGVTLPDFARSDEWWNDGTSSLYLDNFEKAGCVRVDDNTLQRGDIILIQIRSKNMTPNHAAVYLGDGKILHHPYGRLSRIDVYGGMWMQYTRLVVRLGTSA